MDARQRAHNRMLRQFLAPFSLLLAVIAMAEAVVDARCVCVCVCARNSARDECSPSWLSQSCPMLSRQDRTSSTSTRREEVRKNRGLSCRSVSLDASILLPRLWFIHCTRCHSSFHEVSTCFAAAFNLRVLDWRCVSNLGRMSHPKSGLVFMKDIRVLIMS